MTTKLLTLFLFLLTIVHNLSRSKYILVLKAQMLLPERKTKKEWPEGVVVKSEKRQFSDLTS